MVTLDQGSSWDSILEGKLRINHNFVYLKYYFIKICMHYIYIEKLIRLMAIRCNYCSDEHKLNNWLN